MTQDIKKDFQAIVGLIRRQYTAGGSYPKAMMTGQQMMKDTGTINFGSRDSVVIANIVMNHKGFQSFLTKHNAEATIEAAPGTGHADAKQIRIRY